MAQQPERRRCHVLTDPYGLRAFGDGAGKLLGRNAGFNAVAWKLEGESAFKRDLPVNFKGDPAVRLLLEPKLLAKTAALIEIGWPLIVPAEDWAGPHTELLRYIGPSEDRQIQELESMMRNPKRVHESALGRFIRDDQLAWVAAEINWLGQPARASMEAQLDIDIEAQEKVLTALLANQAAWDAKARTAIISGLYELWRDVWREDDPLLSEAEFAARMPLEGINVQRDGDFDLWFKDADLFWGHGVLVRGTLDAGLEPGEMHG